MAILYVASEALELEPLANLLTGLRKLKWPIDYAFEGIWEGRRVMLAANGAGPRLAVRAVETAIRAVSAAELSASRLEAVVATGLCGGLDPNLRENDIVVGTEVLDAAKNERYPCAPVTADGHFTSGLVLTQDRVAIAAGEKAQLAQTGAIAVDMESAAIAAHAKRARLPFACIKAVSDRADEPLVIDFNQMRDPEGRIARGKIGLYALTHPNKIAGLFALRRRANEAAKLLGDFLVGSRIVPVSEDTGTP
jgi:adenosylhomocysteine nucleosidase